MMEVIQVTKTFAVKGDAETGGVLACDLLPAGGFDFG